MAALTVALLMLMAVCVVSSTVLHHRAIGRGSPPAEQLEFYRVAYLAGGRSRVAEVALAYLVWVGLVEVRISTRTVALRSTPAEGAPLAPVERALLATIPAQGGKPTLSMAAARDAAGWLGSEMSGLVVPPRTSLLISLPSIIGSLLAAIVSLGVIIGVSPGTPLGILAIVPVVSLIVLLTTLRRGPRVTKAGRVALDQERDRLDPDLAIAQMGVTSLPIESGLYIVALYGRDAMTGQLAPLARVLARG